LKAASYRNGFRVDRAKGDISGQFRCKLAREVIGAEKAGEPADGAADKLMKLLCAL
jgi:hypothetical protein